MTKTTLQTRRRGDRDRKGRGQQDLQRRGSDRREEGVERDADTAAVGGGSERLDAHGVLSWPRYLPSSNAANPMRRGVSEKFSRFSSDDPRHEADVEGPRSIDADRGSAVSRRNRAAADAAVSDSTTQADDGSTAASARAPEGAVPPQPLATPSGLSSSRTAAEPTRDGSRDRGGGHEGSPETRAKQARQDDPKDDKTSQKDGKSDEPGADAKDSGAKTDARAPSEQRDKRDEKGKKDKKDEKDTARGGRSGRGATLGAMRIADEQVEAEQAFPEELVAVEESPLAVPALEWSTLESQWSLASELPSDALPSAQSADKPTTSHKPGNSTADGDGASAGSAKTGSAKDGSGKSDAPPRPSQADAQRKPEDDARSVARRAYSELVQSAHREMDSFVARANDTMYGMATRYQWVGEGMLSAWRSDRNALRVSVDRAVFEVDGIAAFALLRLDTAAGNAAVAIRKAGDSAFGMIKAREDTAAQDIAAVVEGLVAGHAAAYNGTIKNVKGYGESAIKALHEFRDNRNTNFPLKGRALPAAQNESLHARIPRWADSEAARLQERLDKKVEGWEKSRNSTVDSTKCSFSCSLEKQHAKMVNESRKSVSNALSKARGDLARQASEGRRSLSDQRRSLVQQIRVQGRATESRLASQIRASLDGMRQEAQGAVSGVRNAARGALPSFARTAQGFEQSLRKAAPKGAAALRSSAERGPEGAMLGVRRTASELDGRLTKNRDKLGASLDRRALQQQQSRTRQLIDQETAQTQQVVQGRSSIDQSASGMTVAFEALSDTVAQSAAQWAAPLETHMAAAIAQKRVEAAEAVVKIKTGKGSGKGGGNGGNNAAGGNAGGANNANVAQQEEGCGKCEDKAKEGAQGNTNPGANGNGQGGASGGESKGLVGEETAEQEFFSKRSAPETFFERQIEDTRSEVQKNLEKRATDIAKKFEGGFAGTVDEEGAIAVLRGLTKLKGWALDISVYRDVIGGGMLDDDLEYYLSDDPDDLAACRAYLRGDAVEGARLELKHSTGVFNDDEARIEAVMRSLSPEQLAELGQVAPGTMANVRDALGGTDRKVFDALAKGDYALADALRMKDAVDEARRDRDNDAVHTAIEKYTGAPDPTDWRSSDEAQARAHEARMRSSTPPTAETLSRSLADERREAVVAALGGIVADSVSEGDVAAAIDPNVDMSKLSSADRSKQMATARAIAYVTRGVDVYVNEPAYDAEGRYVGGGGRVVTEKMTGANRDLAVALMRHGEGNIETRAARVGVELNRPGGPNFVNLDKATFDTRFIANHAQDVTPEDREAHRRATEDKARMLMLAAQRYAGGEPTPEHFEPGKNQPNDPNAALNDTHVVEARRRLMAGLNQRFGSDSVSAQLAAGLLTDARPSADTAALAMQHAMYHKSGTNEELIFHFTERMNRDEVQDMRNAFKRQTGKSLDAELGVYGEGGTFTELSGDDRLRMERAMLGVPRNDKEKFETAAFALEQQRRETGSFGAWLAEGTLADQAMKHNEERLRVLAGGPISISRRGELMTNLPIFDAKGRYTGPDKRSFASVTNVAQDIAQNYSSRIDAFADIATTGIAILGAIAAAVITVVTGGAAGPLIAAAVVAGLASMAANYAIKGGRYGWEQAAIDLGMTAVQAITAGVGAQLGAAAQVASKGAQAAAQASRTVAALSRIFTNNPIVNQIIVGAITGGIGGLGGAVFNEQTWDGKDPVGALFAGLLRGAAGGAATAALTSTVETLASKGAAIASKAEEMAARGLIGRGMARVGSGVNSMLTAGTGGGKLSSAGAMIARGSARAVLSGAGGMIGRGAELATDAALGRFKGDVGDAFTEMGHAGLQAAIQGIGEGAGEAVGQGHHNAKVARAGESIAKVRQEMGLEPLHPDTLKAAAEDLLFLNQHGRLGRDGFAKQVNLDHVSTHGGMMPTVVERFPSPAVKEAMRSELLRHVPETQRAELADVPIRVLSAEEFQNFARSQSGHAVTIIENGHPVVVVREGVDIAHLANEGPHLTQARERGTRERVAKLDESKLANWDNLDLDTQIDLYKTKIELEIDAHERIARSLASENPEGPEAMAKHAAEIERNEATLRNLRSRAEEVANLSPELRDAIDSGLVEKPQFLDQPARLFSKERRQPTSQEIQAAIKAEIEEKSKGLPKTGDDDTEDVVTLPHTSPDKVAGGGKKSAFDQTPEEIEAHVERREKGNTFNNEQEPRFPHNEVYIEIPEGGKGYPRLDSYIPGEAIVSRKSTQLAELGEEGAINYLNELVDKYPVGARLADVPSNKALLDAGHESLQGQHVLLIPEQLAPIPDAILRHAELLGVKIVDSEGKVYSVAHPDGDDGVPRASARDPEQHADAMRDALLRHVPESERAALGDTDIVVLREHDYRKLAKSDSGPVFAMVLDGKMVIVVREGTPISRLADEGPHLMQAREAKHAAAVEKLSENKMQQWDKLDLDEQIDLYRTKIELEIDAHERIVRSLANETADTPEAKAKLAADIERNETTLRNLRDRAKEVSSISPEDRAAIRNGTVAKPQYLNQPARLFSKGPKQQVVFEPFVGPDLQSPTQLQQRYPGAQVIAGEAKISPSAAQIDTFQRGGGRFVSTRFGEALPDNSVDIMHVRFPLPHEKAQETMMNIRPGMKPDEIMALAQQAAEAQRNAETLTNLAPTALEKLAPGGRMEVVFDERSIAAEVAQAAKSLEWTDPASGRRYRFETDGEPRSEPRQQLAPHSGFGVPTRREAYVVVMRKVEIIAPAGTPGQGRSQPHAAAGTATGEHIARTTSPAGKSLSVERNVRHPADIVPIETADPLVSKQTTNDTDLRSAVLRHVPEGMRADFADVEIRVMTDSEFHSMTGSKSGHAVTIIENGRPVVIVREGTPLTHLADEGPHLMQFRDKATRAKMLRLDEDTMRKWDSLDLDTQIDLYHDKIALEIDAHEQIARSLAQETPDTPDAKALHAAEVERNEATLRSLRARAKEIDAITPDRRNAIKQGREQKPDYLDQPARLFGKRINYGNIPKHMRERYKRYVKRKAGKAALSANEWYSRTKHNWLSLSKAQVERIKQSSPHGIKAQQIILGTNDKIAVIGRSMGDLKNTARGEAGVVDYARFLRDTLHHSTELFAGRNIKQSWFDEIEALRIAHGVHLLPAHIIETTEFYRENIKWAKKLIDEGYTIIDIGNPNKKTESSPFYEGEVGTTFGSSDAGPVIDWSADNAYPP